MMLFLAFFVAVFANSELDKKSLRALIEEIIEEKEKDSVYGKLEVLERQIGCRVE